MKWKTNSTTVGTVLKSKFTTVGTVLKSKSTTVGTVLKSKSTTVGTVLKSNSTTVGTVLKSNLVEMLHALYIKKYIAFIIIYIFVLTKTMYHYRCNKPKKYNTVGTVPNPIEKS